MGIDFGRPIDEDSFSSMRKETDVTKIAGGLAAACWMLFSMAVAAQDAAPAKETVWVLTYTYSGGA